LEERDNNRGLERRSNKREGTHLEKNGPRVKRNINLEQKEDEKRMAEWTQAARRCTVLAGPSSEGEER